MRTFTRFIILFLYPFCMVYARTPDKAGTTFINNELFFLQNKGQLSSPDKKPVTDIDYQLKVKQGFSVFVSGHALQYQWTKVEYDSSYSQLGDEERRTKTPRVEIYRLRMELIGSNMNADKLEQEAYDYHETYYLQGMPGGTTAGAFKRICYKDVYPNIDWVLYVDESKKNEQALKYDFIVRPGGNVSDIKWRYTGDTAISVKDGNIKIYTPFGTIEDEAPYSYIQEGKKKIDSRFVADNGSIGIETAPYEGTLVIDPAVVWRTYHGGWWGDDAFAVARRQGTHFAYSDYTYIAGTTQSWERVVLPSLWAQPYKELHEGTYGDGTYDCFISAFTINGKQRWGTYYGGSENDAVLAMVADSVGNIYVGGGTRSTSGIATPGAYMETAHGTTIDIAAWYNDGFVAKFDTNGYLQWGSYLGGESWDHVLGLVLDKDENLYITGETYSFLHIATPGVHQGFMAGYKDAFLAKFTSDGGMLWSSYYGSRGGDAGNCLALDDSGFIYLAGTTGDDTCGDAFNVFEQTAIATPGAYQFYPTAAALRCPDPPPSPLPTDGFLVKFRPNGTRVWGTYLGYGPHSQLEGKAVIFDSTSFIDTGGKYVKGLIYFGGVGFFSAFRTNGEIYWRNNSNIDALCLDKNNSLVALGNNAVTTYHEGIGYQFAVLPGGGQTKCRAITTNNQEDHGNYHIYVAGRTFLSTGFALGVSIDSPRGATLGDLNHFSGTGGDAFLAQFMIDAPMQFFIGVPTPPPGSTPPLKWPLKAPPNPLYSFRNFCHGKQYVCFPVVYNAPAFPPTAKFVVQLSDSSGNFENYTIIGSAVGSQPNINCVIPPHVPPGKNYKVRMVCQNPVAISMSETAEVHRTPLPTAGSNTPLCKGDTLMLHATDTLTGNPVHYQWVDKDTSVIFIAKDTFQAQMLPTNAGRYIVTAIVDDACYNNDTVYVDVKELPVIQTVGNTGPVCEGQPLQLLVYADTAGGGSFVWSGNGFSANTANPVISNPDVSHTGMYYVDFSKYGCKATDSTYVIIDTVPKITNIESNSPLCYGDTMKLFAATNVPAAKLTWTGPKNFSSSLPAHYILNARDTMSGYYTFKATLGKCSSQDSIYVTVKPPLAPPGASSNSPVKTGDDLKLFADGPAGSVFSWTGPDSFSSSEQNPVIPFVPYTATGQYYVTMTSDGCSSTAGIVVIVNTTSEVFFVLFPNPNNGTFTVKATLKNDQAVSIQVVNAAGQTIYEDRLVSKKRLLVQPVSLPGSVSSGDYYLRIRADGANKIIPFSVSR